MEDMDREGSEFKSLAAGIRARVAEGFGELKGGPGSGPNPSSSINKDDVEQQLLSGSKVTIGKSEIERIGPNNYRVSSSNLSKVLAAHTVHNAVKIANRLNTKSLELSQDELKGGPGSGRRATGTDMGLHYHTAARIPKQDQPQVV